MTTQPEHFGEISVTRNTQRRKTYQSYHAWHWFSNTVDGNVYRLEVAQSVMHKIGTSHSYFKQFKMPKQTNEHFHWHWTMDMQNSDRCTRNGDVVEMTTVAGNQYKWPAQSLIDRSGNSWIHRNNTSICQGGSIFKPLLRSETSRTNELINNWISPFMERTVPAERPWSSAKYIEKGSTATTKTKQQRQEEILHKSCATGRSRKNRIYYRCWDKTGQKQLYTRQEMYSKR